MRSNNPSATLPALVAGIDVFFRGISASKAQMAGTGAAMTPEKWS